MYLSRWLPQLWDSRDALVSHSGLPPGTPGGPPAKPGKPAECTECRDIKNTIFRHFFPFLTESDAGRRVRRHLVNQSISMGSALPRLHPGTPEVVDPRGGRCSTHPAATPLSTCSQSVPTSAVPQGPSATHRAATSSAQGAVCRPVTIPVTPQSMPPAASARTATHVARASRRSVGSHHAAIRVRRRGRHQQRPLGPQTPIEASPTRQSIFEKIALFAKLTMVDISRSGKSGSSYCQNFQDHSA